MVAIMKRTVYKIARSFLAVCLIFTLAASLSACSDKPSGVYENIIDGTCVEFYGSSFCFVDAKGERYEGRYSIDDGYDPHMISFSFDTDTPLGFSRDMSFLMGEENGIEYVKLGVIGYFYKN